MSGLYLNGLLRSLLLLRDQADPADHRSIHATFPSIRIKKAVMQERAKIHRRNRGYRHTLRLHLPTDQGLEIQPSLMQSIVSHSKFPLRQSRSELIQHRIVHFVAADAGRGSNTDPQIRPYRSKSCRHEGERLRNNPRDCAPPPSMNRRHNTPAWIMHEHRDAIRCAYGHSDAGLVSHQCVPPSGELIRLAEWTVHHQGIRPMHLLDGQQPTPSLRSRLANRYSHIKCQRVCMAARAEEMSDLIARRRESRNRDDGCTHDHSPVRGLASTNLSAQSTCLRRNVGTSHSSSATAATLSIDSLASPIRRKNVGRSRSLRGRSA